MSPRASACLPPAEEGPHCAVGAGVGLEQRTARRLCHVRREREQVLGLAVRRGSSRRGGRSPFMLPSRLRLAVFEYEPSTMRKTSCTTTSCGTPRTVSTSARWSGNRRSSEEAGASGMNSGSKVRSFISSAICCGFQKIAVAYQFPSAGVGSPTGGRAGCFTRSSSFLVGMNRVHGPERPPLRALRG